MFYRRATRSPLSLAILAVALATPVHAAEPAEKRFTLAIERGIVPLAQRVLRVQKNDALRIRVSSDTPGELHLHGYRVQTKLASRESTEIMLKAFATGRFRIEWHPEGVTGANSGHHGAALAVLEVRPR